MLDKLAGDGNKDVLTLRGAAAALLDRQADALADLNRPELADVPEANLFRGYVAARQHDWPLAATDFGAVLPSLDDYPKTARMLVRRAGAEALIRGGNAVGGQAFLDAIRLDMPSAEDQAYYDYLTGLQQAAGEDKEPAIKTWSALAESPIDEVRARSQFDLTELELAEKKIDEKFGKDARELGKACEVVGRHYEREASHLMKNINTVIEPVLTVVLAAIVLVVALSVFLPMWEMIRVRH